MPRREIKAESFVSSVCALALLAMRQTGAVGFAFFRKSVESAALVRHASCGVAIEESALNEGANPAVSRYPLQRGGRPDGVVAFAFEDRAQLEKARPALARMAAAIAAVWAAAPETGRYADLVDRVVELEAQLNDSKITERARGFLENRGGSDVIEAITQHVHRVLSPAPTRRVLEQIQRELEEEVETRVLAARAKEILQSSNAMSEEQAYTYLQTISRRSRRRLRDVAEEVIAQQAVQGKTA